MRGLLLLSTREFAAAPAAILLGDGHVIGGLSLAFDILPLDIRPRA